MLADQLGLKLGPVLIDDLVQQCRFGPVAYIYCMCILPCLAIRVQRQSHGSNKYRQYSFMVLPSAMALPSRCCRQYASINVRLLPLRGCENRKLDRETGQFVDFVETQKLRFDAPRLSLKASIGGRSLQEIALALLEKRKEAVGREFQAEINFPLS